MHRRRATTPFCASSASAQKNPWTRSVCVSPPASHTCRRAHSTTVVESRFRRKKPRGDLEVFQFAQTVEHEAWEDNELKQSLQASKPVRVASWCDDNSCPSLKYRGWLKTRMGNLRLERQSRLLYFPGRIAELDGMLSD